jgi:hypothetical protein
MAFSGVVDGLAGTADPSKIAGVIFKNLRLNRNRMCLKGNV